MSVFRAGNNVELSNALAAAAGGDEIRLAAGEYGDVEIWDATFGSAVHIVSEDPNHPAVFGSLLVRGSKNLTIDGVFVDFVPDAETMSFDSAVEIHQSSFITLVGSRIEGGPSVNGIAQSSTPGVPNPMGNILGLPAARGVTVSHSSDVTLTGNDISQFGQGIIGSSVDGLKVLSNEVHHLRQTNLLGADLDDLLVDGNHFHSNTPWKFGGLGDHANFIRVWTNSGQTVPNSGITITNNFMEKGEGVSVLGVSLEDNSAGYGFRNAIIEDNVILTGHGSGVVLENVIGASVSRNSLLQPPGNENPPLIVLSNGTRDVTVDSNIVSDVRVLVASGLAGTIHESNSLELQWTDQFADSHYSNALIDPLQQPPSLESLQAIPGGLIETRGVGADLTRLDLRPSAPHGWIESERGEGFGLASYPFDASHVYGPEGRVSMAGAAVSWDFGDGSSATGVSAPHSYKASGVYSVTADIRLADGREFTLSKVVQAESPVAFRADFQSGFGDATGSVPLRSVSASVASVTGPDGKAADLNGGDIVYNVDSPFFGNPEYSMLIDFKKDAGSVGDVSYLVKLSANITIILLNDGINVSFRTDKATDGWIQVSGLGIDDTDWHKLAFTFSGKTGDAILYLDGAEVGRDTGFKDHVQSGYSTQDLRIGDGFKGAIDNLTFLRGALSAADVNSGHIPVESAGGGGAAVLAPVPVPVSSPAPGSSGSSDAELAAVSQAIAAGDLAGLAGDLGATLATGYGDNGDNVVRAGSDAWRSAKGYGGDDVLVGNAYGNWLLGGLGDKIMYGGGGADEFRFNGGDVADAKSDVILDADFAEGDRIILTGYEAGTFSGAGGSSGLNVFSGGSSAIVSSLEALSGLAKAADVSLASDVDGLTLAIEQSTGSHDLRITGVSTGAGSPSPSQPSSPAPGSSGSSDAELAAVSQAIAAGDLAGLAGDLGATLATGYGDNGDNVVRAGSDAWRSAKGYGGDDVLVGNAYGNWLLGGLGDKIMYGGGGADEFRFNGGDVADAKSDVILDADFAEGDRIILTGYEAGTFSGAGGSSGLNVFSGGSSAIVSSLEALSGLAKAADVSIASGVDGVTLAIEQSAGSHDLLLV